MPAHRVRIVIGVTLLAACATPQSGRSGGGVGAGPAEGASETCLLSPGGVTARPRTNPIGLTEPVDPRHAPIARNDAERIVFRHLYETPVRVDCQGNVLPELTEKWVRDDDGRRWIFRLRDGAHYWDGAPVTAQDVVYGKGGVGYTLGALDPRVVTVALAKPRDDVPAVLGDATLAVAKAAPDSSWPIGTGHYWATSGTTTPPPPPGTATPRRILYARSDPTARELAGRLAALTHAATAARAPDDLSAAVAGGKEWGYVLALPRITTDPCRAAKDLLPSWAATITALVDTRATAIARRGVARWTVDLDGTAHLAPSP